jgi:hypothetical protein
MMKTSIFALGLLAASAALTGTVSAAPRGDTNGDGKLALVEFQTLAKTRMLRADNNSDGKISLDEWKARPAAAKAKRDPAKVFGRLDRNDDGFIDTAEIDPMLKKRFDRIDANADGAVTAEELSANRQAIRAKKTGAGN